MYNMLVFQVQVNDTAESDESGGSIKKMLDIVITAVDNLLGNGHQNGDGESIENEK